MIAKRINWIDWAKVVAIFLVVYGHIPQEKGAQLLSFICTFHMPLFFMLSGYLVRVCPNEEWTAFWHKQWKSLVLPYFLWNLVYYPYWLVWFFLDQHGKFNLFEVGFKPMMGVLLFQIQSPYSSVVSGVTWFLGALLVMRVLLEFVYKCFSCKWSMFFLLCGVTILLYIVNPRTDNFCHSLIVEGVLRCTPFFLLGHLLRIKFFFERLSLSTTFWGALMCLGLSVLFFSGFAHPKSSMALSYIVSVLGCMGTLLSCRLLDGFSSRIMIRISAGTIVIMGMHWMCIGSINYVVRIFTHAPSIVYEWYTALFLSCIILIILYPFIILSSKYFPQLLGRRKIT